MSFPVHVMTVLVVRYDGSFLNAIPVHLAISVVVRYVLNIISCYCVAIAWVATRIIFITHLQ